VTVLTIGRGRRIGAMGLESVGSPLLWLGFIAFVLAMLAVDLLVFHRRAHEVRIREALVWSVVWISLSLLFCVGVYFGFGADRALEFLAGYVVEKALSIDNLFVFAVVMSTFAVPPALQHRLLFWGIVSALVLRAAFIIVGAEVLQHFHWVIYLFGAFLVFTGVKLIVKRDAEVNPKKNPLVDGLRRVVPTVDGYRGTRFTVRENGRLHATTLLLALVAIETTDIIFAVDSIPAIFGITSDPFIVFTSNIFAILGLRALYFVLAGMLDKFRFLNVGLALVLCFVGTKMLIAGVYKVPIGASLGVVAALIGGSIVASLFRSRAKGLERRGYGQVTTTAGDGHDVRKLSPPRLG
jgi:tellurite resistance protein TerC